MKSIKCPLCENYVNETDFEFDNDKRKFDKIKIKIKNYETMERAKPERWTMNKKKK